jgi:hypothetical protein
MRIILFKEKKMVKKFVMISALVIACFGLFYIYGCENDAMTGAAVGTAAGAGIGQLAGRNTGSTLIGAAVGGGAGYLIGNESDKKKTVAETQNLREEMNTVTVNVNNSNGSVVQVKLRKSGIGYLGPRGEYYNSLPTSEQLKPIYGF